MTNRLDFIKFTLFACFIFWAIMFLISVFGGYDLFSGIVVGLETAIYFVLWKKLGQKKWNYYIFALIFTGLNTLLSITDEVGFYDILSLGLNGLAFSSLILARKLVKEEK